MWKAHMRERHLCHSQYKLPVTDYVLFAVYVRVIKVVQLACLVGKVLVVSVVSCLAIQCPLAIYLNRYIYCLYVFLRVK